MTNIKAEPDSDVNKSSKNDPVLGSLLGIKGKYSAGHELRGLQPIHSNGENFNSAAKKEPDIIEIVNQETGEILNFVDKGQGLKLERTSQEYRALRFAMKAVVNRLFPHSETSKCCRAKIPAKKVKILKDKKHLKAFYAGLRKCSSVWLCPVCAAKIAERRSAFLQKCIDSATAKGWHVYLLNATFPHGIGDDLKTVLDRLLAAWSTVTGDRSGKFVKKTLQVEGTIRALEVTYSDKNGFHPHLHVLIFTRKNWTPNALELLYRPLWQDCCVKAGLPRPDDLHGLTVQSAEMAAAYVAKGMWGMSQEMTKGYQKTAKSKKGLTPWGFLMEVLENGSKRHEGLFYVYANAFFGKRQLRPSDGLYKKLDVKDKTDEELTEEEEEFARVLSEITDNQWRSVLISRSEAPLLDLAERDPSQITNFLNTLEVNYFKQARKGEFNSKKVKL